jgi:D-3-phosphoglycerate dehydrogenase
VVNALNMPSVSAEDAPRLKPYMKLSEQIGSLAGQVIGSSVKAVSVEYEGMVSDLNTRPLTACVLKGLLTPMMESVNMVNAPIIARERDIDVSEVKRERSQEFQTLIRLTVTTENQTRTVAGTLFSSKPRIVDLNGVRLEAELTENMLFTQNSDKPGHIGAIGTILADGGINIATFHLGRDKAGGTAVALIEVDQPLDEDTLKKVCALPNVVRAKTLHF